MKFGIKYLLSCITFFALAIVSCTPDVIPNVGTGSEQTNYITFTSESTPLIYEAGDIPLAVDVTLSSAMDSDLTLRFAVSDRGGIVRLADSRLVFKAGQTHGQLQIVSTKSGKLTEVKTFLLGLVVDSKLPAGLQVKENFEFIVTPFASDVMTDVQKSAVQTYKEKTGVDLTEYLGFVNVNTVFVGTGGEPAKPLEPVTFKGKSVIAFSDKTTADSPVLAMTSNAMGIQDKMYEFLRAVTVRNEEWTRPAEEGGIADYMTLMNAIKWTANSNETFVLGLDNIVCGSDGNISFLGKGVDSAGDAIDIVPFNYQFSAFQRELAAIADGTLKKGSKWWEEATAKPEVHLNNENVATDVWAGGNWVKASASISSEKMEFTFCFYPSKLFMDYVRVTATYTPSKAPLK